MSGQRALGTGTGLKIKKNRLDKLLVQRGLCESREKARALILAGQVVVGEHRVDKAGTQIREDAPIRLKRKASRYVSRGGDKLAGALDVFGAIEVAGRRALDLGASTGGFSDCLLQRGCREVTAVDVGYGQLHQKLRADERVISLERTNARHLTREVLGLEADDPGYDLIVADLSFISLRLVLAAVGPLLAEGGDMVLLVKPQFEAGRTAVGKGGVVRDDALRQRCAQDVVEVAASLGLVLCDQMDSPVHGPKGNIEILVWLRWR